jgi:hypothetical protein
MLYLSQGIKVCRSVRIVRSVRTVKWLYHTNCKIAEPHGSWRWFTDREPTLSMAMLSLSQGIKVCQSVRIVQSVRTVKWLYEPYEPYGSWKWFTDRKLTLSIRKKRKWVMLRSSQGREVCRSVRIVRSVQTVKWLYGSYFSSPIFHSVNATIIYMMAQSRSPSLRSSGRNVRLWDNPFHGGIWLAVEMVA